MNEKQFFLKEEDSEQTAETIIKVKENNGVRKSTMRSITNPFPFT